MEKCEKVVKAFDCPVAIVFSTNDSFAKYLSAMLQSIIDCSQLENTYDIVILTSDMSDRTFGKLSEMICDRVNFCLRRINVNDVISSYAFFTDNVDRLSQETYYRLLIPELFRDYERVIYLDGDMIARVDVAKLYEIPFEGNSLISSRDMNGVMYCHSDYEDGIERALYRRALMAPHNPDDYVIAGLLVFNIERVCKYSAEELLNLAASREWLQHDQDVVNYLFSGDIKLIHAKWDFLHEVNRHHIGYMPKDLQREYYEAEQDPFIVHYGGNRKPWTAWYVENDLLFWRALSRTPFFDEVFYGIKWKVEYKSYVLRHLFSVEPESRVEDGRVIFSHSGKVLGDYNQTVSISFCSIHDDCFEIEGLLPRVGLRSSDHLQVFLRNSKGIFLNLGSNLNSEWFRKEGDLKWVGLPFRFVVPIEGVDSAEFFGLFYSVNGHYYQSSSFSFGRHCAIGDELYCSYQYEKGRLLSFDGSRFSIRPISKSGVEKCEKELIEELSYWKCGEEARALRSRVREESNENSIWLFVDGVGVEKGNSRALFSHVRELAPAGVNPILVVDSSCPEAYETGACVLRNSEEHKRLYLRCSLCFTSSRIQKEFDPFYENRAPYRDLLSAVKVVYMPHVEIFSDISDRFNRAEFNPWILAVSSEREARAFIDNPRYSLVDSHVACTGTPRYDAFRRDQKKAVIVIPANRTYLMRNVGKAGEEVWRMKDNFCESDYFLFYNSLMSDPRLLRKAEELGYSICFVYHREMADSIRCFDRRSESIDFVSFEDYESASFSAQLYITDYSEFIADAFQLQKPVLYAEFPEIETSYCEHPFGRSIVGCEMGGGLLLKRTR